MSTSLLQQLKEEIILCGYSPRTLKSYLSCVAVYLRKVNGDLDISNVRGFLVELHETGKAGQTVNLYLNAIKFFYKNVIKESRVIAVKFAKKSKRLPSILSRKEIQMLLSTISNKKSIVK